MKKQPENMTAIETSQDDLVMQLFAKVQQKQREIKASERPSWETSCTFGLNPDIITDRVNIQTVTDVTKIIDLYAFLTVKHESFNKVADELGLDTKFKYMGFSFAQWKTDFLTRINQIGLNKKRKELEVLQERLDALITPQQRRDMELKEIQKLMETT